MLKKTIAALMLLSAVSVGVQAQRIKSIGKTAYFQAPSQGVKFASANVYMSYDQALATAQKEEKQAKNTATGSKFGAIGGMVAETANSALDGMDAFSKVMTALQDEEGHFDTWSFVPEYIIAEVETDKAVNVEIFILNEANPDPMGPKAPTTADKNGFYDVPYYVNCRYKVTDYQGNVLHEENFGGLSGTMKTKSYTPPTVNQVGSLSEGLKATAKEAATANNASLSDIPELCIEDQLGTNAAFQAVREAVYARFGFSTLYAPMGLGVVKEAKETKKMITPTLAVFENKKGFLLSKDEKATVTAFVEELEKNLSATTEKTKWVALHNLSLCYAWLENAEKSNMYYAQYGDAIRPTLDKMECWVKVMEKKMTSKEMKEKCGSTFIGMKDQKKFAQYNNIGNFVKFYAAGATRYENLFYTINRDLAKFTDFYALNDLLCQLYEIDYPFQFLPLNDMEGAPKDCRATITKEGMKPIEYRVKYDRHGRIKNFEADQVTKFDDGSKEKLLTRDIKPQYDENTGKYLYFETGGLAGEKQMVTKRSYVNNFEFSGYKYYFDPVASMTKANLDDITKNSAGFFMDRSANENIQMKVDLDGKMFFTGKSSYFKANAFFKSMLDAYGIVPKRVDTWSKFSTEAKINEQGIMTDWTWNGSVTTDFAGALETRKQNLKADEMTRGIYFTEVDEHGNPIKAKFVYKLKGSMNLQDKVSISQFFSTWDVEGEVSSESFNVSNDGIWDCSFEYDAAGNWTKMIVGPYTAEREIKY